MAQGLGEQERALMAEVDGSRIRIAPNALGSGVRTARA